VLSVTPLWTPDPARAAGSQVVALMAEVNRRYGLALKTYRDLHAWSIAHADLFWDLVWDFCGIIGDKGGRLLADGDKMPGARFFPDARLNFAENLLRRADAGEAMVFRGEDKVSYRLTWGELDAMVSRMQQALKAAGIGVGDESCDQRYGDERDPHAHQDQDDREDLARRIHRPDLAEPDGRQRDDGHVERVEERPSLEGHVAGHAEGHHRDQRREDPAEPAAQVGGRRRAHGREASIAR